MQKVYSIKERLMRYLFACIFMMLALPAAAAQPGKECRGKQTFELSDGTTGCLLQLDTTNITRTLSRDDGQSKSQKKQAVLSVVGLYGKFDTRMRVTSKRMKEICTAVMPAMQQKNGGRTPQQIVVQMVWPGVGLPKPTRANGGQYLNQVAELNSSCRSPQYFGSRTR
jgi:hypothetical protein